jgi:hypothetical protein
LSVHVHAGNIVVLIVNYTYIFFFAVINDTDEWEVFFYIFTQHFSINTL